MRLSSPSLLLLVCSPAFAFSQQPPQKGGASDTASSSGGPTLITRHNISHDVSQPLRDLARNVPPLSSQAPEADDLKAIPLPSGFKPANEPDPVLQKPLATSDHAAAAALGPTMGLNFEGLGAGFPNFNVTVAPPDTNGAVGLTQYVQWVNLSFAVFDKATGKVTLGPVAGNTLWAGFGGGCQIENNGDPIVTYDKLADRWVFSQLVFRSGPFLQCIAVSTSSDATGTYNRYSFEYSDLDDYPKMGVWPDAYFETFNMFIGGVTFAGADACAYDRNAMLNGLPATQICFQQVSTVSSLLPADLDGHFAPPPGSPNYMVTFNVNSLDLYKFHVDFVTPGNSTFTGPVNIPVAPFTPLCFQACVPQPGGSGTPLDALGDRLMYRLAYRNFGDHESLVVNHSVVADSVVQNSGVRWYEIRNPNGATPPVVNQQATFAPDSSFRWMGSIAMDVNGDIAVGYTVINASSTSPLFASGAFAARAVSDPADTLQPENVFVTGTGAQTGLTRWGDYSAMQVDPVDDCTFWYTTEYLQTTGSFDWNTRITNFKFPGCGGPDLKMVKSHSGNFTQGQSGVYTLTISNIGGKATDGSQVTVTDALPAGLTATSIGSTDKLWVCSLATLTCTRSDVLAAGAVYPAITVNVSVAANAPGLVTNQATVSGGGDINSSNNTASDLTEIIVTGPDPAIAETHVPMVQGQSGTYTITVTNVGLTATDPTKPLTVTDVLPSALTATATGGTGWGTCTVQPSTVTCTRSDSLASNQSFPPITISVNVASNAPAEVVNSASVTGGGDTNPLNNNVSDPTLILSAAPGLFITSPIPAAGLSASTEFKPGTQIPVTGTATGPSFQDFRMQWAEGANPTTGWSSVGITLAGGGASPVTNGPLGTWDTSGITAADYYTLRLLVDNAGFTNETTTIVYLEPSLLSLNWPFALRVAPDLGSGFLPATDASGNQRLALVTPIYLQTESLPAQYLSFSGDGSSQTAVQIPQPSYDNPAVGPVEGVPGDDVAIPNVIITGPGTAQGQMQFFRPDNSTFNFQLPSGFNFNFFSFSTPVLEDVEGKGQLDVLNMATSTVHGLAVDPAPLFVWRPDASVLPNFPFFVGDSSTDLVVLSRQRAFVADLNGDGNKEIIVQAGLSSSTFTLLRFAHDGTALPWSVPVFTERPFDLAFADLDHNGKLEILLLMFDGSVVKLHVFQPDGSERAGFPAVVGSDLSEFGNLAVGDLNRDGVEEIVVAPSNGTLVVLEPDGTLFPGSFSQGAGFLNGPIALADIDGDGFPEILVTQYSIVATSSPGSAPSRVDAHTSVETTQNPQGLIQRTVTTGPLSSQQGFPFFAVSILAVRHDGTLVRTWHVPGANGNQPYVFPTITVGDFNGDGITDIAINNFTVDGGGVSGSLTGGVAMVLSTGGKFNAAANDWPMLHHDPRNSAVLRRDVTLSITAPAAGATVSGTVLVSAMTAGPVASVQFILDGAKLGAPVAISPFSISWDTTQAANGLHKIVAVATDQNGQPIASAPVSVTVTGGKSPSSVTVVLTQGANPANLGDTLTFQATLKPNTATGNVVFFDGATPISGNVPVSSGLAALTTSTLAVGTHPITAQYSGDSTFGASVSTPLTEQILKTSSVAIALTVGTNPAKLGDPLTFQATVTPAAATGNIVFFDGSFPITGGVPVISGVAGFTTSSLSTGAHAITARYNGDSNFSSSLSAPFSEQILGASTSVVLSLTNGTNPAKLGDLLTFQATVTPNTVTGNVTIFDGNTAIASNLFVNAGTATFTTSALAGGTHSLTAHYSGDINFNSSVSSVLIQNVMDFNVAASPQSATINAGGSATFTFTVTPLGGFNQTANFSCSGLPELSQCSFVPPSITPNGAPASTMLSISTTAGSSTYFMPTDPGTRLPLYASLFGAMITLTGLLLDRRRKSDVRKAKLWLGWAVFSVLILLTSCGGGSGPPPPHQPGTPQGTSRVTVLVSTGTSSKTATVTLTVQ